MRSVGVKSGVKSAVRRTFSSSSFGFILLRADNVCVWLSFLFRIREGRRYGTLLVAPPGAGNIGDQALVEAALDNSAGPLVLILRRSGDISIPSDHLDRVHVVEMHSLIYGHSIRRFYDLIKFCNYARCSDRTWLIGADVMDGAYNPLASVSRFSCVIAAAKVGSKASILGFSWNSHGTTSATYCARVAAKSTRLFARDSASRERLLASNVSPVMIAADAVFSREVKVQQSLYSEWAIRECAKGKKIAVVNASALLAGKYDQLSEYQTLIAVLDPKLWSIVFVPHVRRSGNDDFACISDLASAVEGLDYKLVDELLSPSEIFAILLSATFVLTGRMHLAVLAINAGIYPVTMSSQGKVAGLYDMLGSPELCIEPGAGCSAEMVSAFRSLEASGFHHIPDRVRDEIRSLSIRNFAPTSS